jgi:nucleoside-diphosphate-sugar epimerase
MAKRVLVSGAGGFIGRWSVPPLRAAGYEVHAVVRRTASREAAPQLRGAVIHLADLLDAAAMAALMETVRPSHLLHFAWVASPGIYWTSPDNLRWLTASQDLIRAFHASGGSRAVMAGTCAEYDWSAGGLCSELVTPLADDRGGPVTLYAECKIAMQKALDRYGCVHGLSTAWGRIFFQFGPAEHPDRLAASVIRSLLSQRAAPCTHGRQIRSFMHVADVGAAFAALLDSALEGPVNIGGAEPVAIAELLREIASQTGHPELLQLGARPAPLTEPAWLVPDVRRLHRDLGFRPRFDLRDGVADTIAWWRQRGDDASPAGSASH